MELVVREFDGKALLSAYAALAGWTAVFGWKRKLYEFAETLPEGVFLLKSATPNEAGQIKFLKKAGHKVCSLDEEGLVDQVSSFESNLRYNDDALDNVDFVFFWGEMQAKAFAKALPKHTAKGRLTGSPRSDFWRYHARAVYQPLLEKLRHDYGNYIFFPSSFGGAMHRMGKEFGVGLTFEMGQRDISDFMAKMLVAQGELLTINFHEYLDFFPGLAQDFPDTKFIIRPHPSEAHDPWRALAKQHDNIIVAYDGAVTPWILGATGMLHFRSTTSVEAYLMGANVFTYAPPLPEYLNIADLQITAAVSCVAQTRQETKEIVRGLVGGRPFAKPDGVEGLLKDWMYEGQMSASYNIIEAIEEIKPKVSRGLDNLKPNLRFKLKRDVDSLLLCASRNGFLKGLMPKTLYHRANAEDYGQHKELGMSLEHAEKIAVHVESTENALRKAETKKISVKELMNGLIVMS